MVTIVGLSRASSRPKRPLRWMTVSSVLESYACAFVVEVRYVARSRVDAEQIDAAKLSTRFLIPNGCLSARLGSLSDT